MTATNCMTLPHLYILTGTSFAGKSVLAKAISETRGIPIVDPDAIAHEHGLGLHGEFLSDAQWGVIHAEAASRARAFLQKGQDVIYDTTNFTFAQRDRLRRLATGVSATPILIYVRTAREEALNRLKRNEESGERFAVRCSYYPLKIPSA